MEQTIKNCSQDADPNRMDGNAQPATAASDGFPVECGRIVSMKASATGLVKLGGRNVSLKLFADAAKFFGNLDSPVADKTGLAGDFDFTLEYARDAGPDTLPDEPSFLTALTTQMGIKLKAGKKPEPALVLDHVERPSTN